MKNKKLVISLLAVIILALLFIVFPMYYKKKQIDQKKKESQISIQFKTDSLEVKALEINKTNDFHKMQMLEERIRERMENKKNSYKILLEKLEASKFIFLYGTYYFDEFSKELIKSNEKKVEVLYKDRNNYLDKYKIERIYKGYKNNKNRKADRLKKKYGWTNEECINVVLGSYWIGMSDEMARESLGAPTKINRTMTSSSTTEQWVYRSYNMYLYFYDGILKTVQN